MSHVDIHALTGPYVLDALPADERSTFEQHLAGCAECTAEITMLREAVAKLAAEAATPAPAHLKAAVMSAITQVQQLPTEKVEPAALTPVASTAHRRFSRRSALALAAAALAAVASGGIAMDQYRANIAADQANDQLAALLAEPDTRTVHGTVSGGGRVTVVASARKDAAVVVMAGMPDLPSRQIYQMWLIDSTNIAHSVGLTTGQAQTQMKFITGGVAGKAAFGVTVEPAGGSAKPTMPAAVIISMA